MRNLNCSASPQCVSPLYNWDAPTGCLAEAMQLHHKALEGKTIQYVNVMNLYPYICKYFKFHLGDLVNHVGDACKDMETCLPMIGLIKCFIVRPERLYHSVIAFRNNHKLMFFLC